MKHQHPTNPDTPHSTFPPLTALSLRGRGGVRAVSGICRHVISPWIARKASGRKSHCKGCDSAKSKRSFAENRERVLASRAEHNRELSESRRWLLGMPVLVRGGSGTQAGRRLVQAVRDGLV